MGRPKALIRFSNSRCFLDQVLHVYASAGVTAATVVLASSMRQNPACRQILTSLRRLPAAMPTTFLYHTSPSADRLASVAVGLANTGSDSYIFLQDVDRPFITKELLRGLKASIPFEGFVAPDIDGHGGHPMLLSPECGYALSQRLSTRHSPAETLRDAMADFSRRLIPIAPAWSEERHAQVNINSLDDYALHFGRELSS